jgi:hypothetical protein
MPTTSNPSSTLSLLRAAHGEVRPPVHAPTGKRREGKGWLPAADQEIMSENQGASGSFRRRKFVDPSAPRPRIHTGTGRGKEGVSSRVWQGDRQWLQSFVGSAGDPARFGR